MITGVTAPTITFPAGISWVGGNAPTINASKKYLFSFLYITASIILVNVNEF